MLVRAAKTAEQQARLAWYLARVVSPSLKRTRDGLAAFGIECFLPKLREWKRKAKRHLSHAQRNSKVAVMIEVDRPLWQGYLLVRFDLENDAWRNVFNQVGLVGIIGRGDEHIKPQPYRIPDAAITVLKEFSVRKHGDAEGAIPAAVTRDELVRRMRAVMRLTAETPRAEQREQGFKVGDRVEIEDGPFASFPAIIEELPDVPLGQLDESDLVKCLVSCFGRETPIELEIGSISKIVSAA